MGDGQEGNWRKQIIAEVLARMREEEAAEPGKLYATVLGLRQSRPKATIEELARELSTQIGAPVSPEAFRKVLQRAATVPYLVRRVSSLRGTPSSSADGTSVASRSPPAPACPALVRWPNKAELGPFNRG